MSRTKITFADRLTIFMATASIDECRDAARQFTTLLKFREMQALPQTALDLKTEESE